jgi:methionyl-tRNA formyltransferase
MSQSLNLVFCGTPQFAVPTLEKLVAAGFPVPLVITQPDRPKGRGLELVASPVKQCALRHHLPVYQPEKIRANQELEHRLTEIAPAAIVVVGYGRIIPKWMLDLPRYGNINLHASILRSIEVLLPSNGQLRAGKPSPAFPPCASTKASIPETFCCSRNSGSPTMTPLSHSPRVLPRSAPI